MKRLLVTVSVVLILSVLACGCAAPAPTPTPAAGTEVSQITCPSCGGSGIMGEAICSVCHGTGKVTRVKHAIEEEVIHWMAHSSWTKAPGHMEWADYYFEKVSELSKGRLVIDKVYHSGELVGGFEVIPAVVEGKIDIGHSSAFYLLGTRPLNALFVGSAATRLLYSDEHWMWMFWGGGLEMYQEYMQEVHPVWMIPTGSVCAEPLYTTKLVKEKADFKGLKVRTTGLGVDFYNRLGCAALTIAMAEVVPMLERGALDGLEYCVPYTDWPAHIEDVAPYALTGLIHQPTLVCMEAFVSLDKYNALPDDLKRTLQDAAELTFFWSLSYVPWKNMTCLEKMIDAGLTVTVASPELQEWFFEVGDAMAADLKAKDPWAKRILEAQEAFHEQYMEYGTCIPWFGSPLVPGACAPK